MREVQKMRERLSMMVGDESEREAASVSHFALGVFLGIPSGRPEAQR